MHGLAQRIRGFAEVEIEHPVGVGNHGGRAPANRPFLNHYALIPGPDLVTGAEVGRACRGMPWRPDPNPPKLSLALSVQGDVICTDHLRTRSHWRGFTGQWPTQAGRVMSNQNPPHQLPRGMRTLPASEMHVPGKSDHEHPDTPQGQSARASARRARGGLFHAAGGFSSRRAAIVPQRYAVAVFRTAAQGSAGALLHQIADRALLVGHQIQRHHACRYQPRHLLLRRVAWRYLDPGRSTGL